jgi:hypothetical protein
MHNILGSKSVVNKTLTPSNHLIPNIINKSPLIFEGIYNNRIKKIPETSKTN